MRFPRGSPRLEGHMAIKDVDGRDDPGHDDVESQ